jgi:hypothetical protein
MSRSRRPDDIRSRPPAGGRPDQRRRPGAGARPGPAGAAPSLRSSPLTAWLGQLSTRNALLALAAGTVVGIIGTLAAGSEPGFLLGFFITIGAVVGVLGVRRGAVYLLFPLPPFAFFVGAVITGKVRDSGISSTTTGLYASLLQWIADIFVPMCVATIAVLLIGGVRWVLGLMLVGGQFPMSGDRPAGPRDLRPRTAPGPRTDVDPWADPSGPGPVPGPAALRPAADDPQAANAQSGRRPPRSAPWPDPDGPRPPAPPRDSRGDRDTWSDPRPGTPADRRPPARNAPSAAAPQPSFQPRPAKPAPVGDRRPRPPAPPRPARPPSDPWEQGY